MGTFVCVHLGAGYHSRDKEPKYKKLSKLACVSGGNVLSEGGGAVEAVVEALTVLEDDPLCNAGFGSNLTIDGKVECDAGLMDGRSLSFASVSAASGVKNPVRVASRLLTAQMKGKMSLDREPPMTLTGGAVCRWARAIGENTVDEDALVSVQAKAAHEKYMLRLAADAFARQQAETPLDTVGACAVDSSGNVASGVSSGGVLLKQPGRVGQAAAFGCGCWAVADGDAGVAVSTTGRGEQLVKTFLAKELGDAAISSNNLTLAVTRTFNDKFLNSRFLKSEGARQAGALVLTTSKEHGAGELTWAHTTSSMCVAYLHVKDGQKPKALVSRLPDNSVDGGALQMQGISFKV